MKKLSLVLDQFDEGVYYCTDGDTLKSIATRFSTSEELLIKDNNLTCAVKAGDVIYVKRYKFTYTVKVGDTPETVAKILNLSIDEMYRLNRINYIYPYLTLVSNRE